MTYVEFYQDYIKLREQTPNYRLGQHFINLFIKDESDPVLEGLWQANERDALLIISNIVNTYQWDYSSIPLLDKGE